MKQYYTLVQDFGEHNKALGDYLSDQGIKFDLGADTVEELKNYGYKANFITNKDIVKKYVVLLDEYELSAITLSVDGVQVIGNRTFATALNKVRGCFKWFLN